tara:strand:- start:17 stop:250 length:234 start_codon:yes stop_codon:yes gene_type:complete
MSDITINKITKQDKKNVLINWIDVKYREIENFENQYSLLYAILDKFNVEDLQNIAIASVRMQKFDKKNLTYNEIYKI